MESDERTAAIARCDGGNDDVSRVLTAVRGREDWPRQPETEPGSGSDTNTTPMSGAEETFRQPTGRLASIEALVHWSLALPKFVSQYTFLAD